MQAQRCKMHEAWLSNGNNHSRNAVWLPVWPSGKPNLPSGRTSGHLGWQVGNLGRQVRHFGGQVCHLGRQVGGLERQVGHVHCPKSVQEVRSRRRVSKNGEEEGQLGQPEREESFKAGSIAF